MVEPVKRLISKLKSFFKEKKCNHEFILPRFKVHYYKYPEGLYYSDRDMAIVNSLGEVVETDYDKVMRFASNVESIRRVNEAVDRYNRRKTCKYCFLITEDEND